MKLSVLMITYNQERYIAQALDSALMQETDFDFEIVVGEDCSKDATRKILLDYADKFPGKIKLLLHEKNVGMINNLVQTFNACDGKYIALLEGDDYWLSPKKLQRQVDLLEADEGCAICFTKTRNFYQDDDREAFEFPTGLTGEVFTIEDLLQENFMNTCSVVFRNGLFASFPEWFYASSLGDYPLHLFNADHGHIIYIDELMSAYRIHREGVWSTKMERNLINNLTNGIRLYENLNGYFDLRYARIIDYRITELNYILLGVYLRGKNYREAYKTFHRLLTKSRALYGRKCLAELSGKVGSIVRKYVKVGRAG